ncbi:DUF6390 family protein [Mycobacterium aquaticum]|uniref:Uncharacterized protein n=1 Tax=Mycobacterium aquaticum TaxID=1927124 RepID=A0A1X0ACG9_9MYCO|nr:DUF6390 family protein [Mycobacterium aquaticum]ORA27712.1 hypothetical protein BST13_29970 [Mycobacterium aquaticum]
MTNLGLHTLPAGSALFARYAYPPNELGYCGPGDSGVLLRGDDAAELASHAREFDGAWPYLSTIARATGSASLDVDVVRGYWVGGPPLRCVDPAVLLKTLRAAFSGQVTGLLDDVESAPAVLAHHSFHVFVVYPWVRFLDREPTTALKVLQSCRIRWGTVTAIDGEHAVIDTQPLVVEDGKLRLGPQRPERVRWSRDGASFVTEPAPGTLVSAHWDWVCDTLSGDECAALCEATTTTIDMVNAVRRGRGGLP